MGSLIPKLCLFLLRSVSLRFADGGPDDVQDFQVDFRPQSAALATAK